MKEAKHICNSIQPISSSVEQPSIVLFFVRGGGVFLIYNHDLQEVNLFSTNECTLPMQIPVINGLNKRNKYTNQMHSSLEYICSLKA